MTCARVIKCVAFTKTKIKTRIQLSHSNDRINLLPRRECFEKICFLFSSSFLLGIKTQLENFRLTIEATNSVLDLVIIMTQQLQEIKMVYFHKDKVAQLSVIGW